MPPLSIGTAIPQISRCIRLASRTSHRYLSSVKNNKFFRVAEEVQDALNTGEPVVALETTIYTHGFPYPENVALASHLESLVRVNGGIPATIGIINGVAHVGMQPEEIIQLVSTAGSEDTWKLSRRDLGFIGGLGLRGQRLHGGTTIAGTMILAHLAGIKIFATGGLGGVHRGGENSMDISADLTELGRTPVAVISSGCKSFLDVPRTLEYLETQGVGVGTFADGRTGNVDFPAFFCRDSGVKSPRVIQNESDAAAIVHAQFSLPVHSGLLLANPVPENAAMSKAELDQIIATAVAEAEEQKIGGAENTPYILKRIRELSKGGSVGANKALIEANVIRGTKVAVELAKLELKEEQILERSESRKIVRPVRPAIVEETSSPEGADILVAGSLACDTSCDYEPLNTVETSAPLPQTSNPSGISQSAGGVGRNVAMAARLSGAAVSLASVVADDIAGLSLLDNLARSGLSPDYTMKLSVADGARTAQYVAVNDKNKDLVLAMADMSILARPELESISYWNQVFSVTKPKWAVIDANWSAPILSSIITAARSQSIQIAFEPVSTAKAARLFHRDNKAMTDSSVVPNHIVNIASPNVFELGAMYNATRSADLFSTKHWFPIIDSIGISSAGARDRFTAIVGKDLTDQGVPQQCVQLLPFIPSIITKLGSKGCLLTTLVGKDDPRLTSPESAPFVLSRNMGIANSPVGGVYMRLFPAAETVKQEDIVSVNGIGDTMLGVVMAGLVKGMSLEDVIPVAQRAAVLSLKSKEAVSPEVASIATQLGRK